MKCRKICVKMLCVSPKRLMTKMRRILSDRKLYDYPVTSIYNIGHDVLVFEQIR